VIYSDTDSVYFCDAFKWNKETSERQFKLFESKEVDNVNLGGAKLEIRDKLNVNSADLGIFLTLKMYGLYSSQTDLEYITFKGLP